MNAIVPFHSELGDVRVVQRDGEPWFVLTDLCQLLGIKNAAQAAKPLDDSERCMFNIGRQGDATLVSLPGALTLMVRCRGAMKPDTIPYRVRKWITAEVVPSVMRQGSYGVAAVDPLKLDDATLRALLLGKIDQLGEMRPKVEAFERLADATGLLCLTDAAKALGVPPRRMMAWMEAHGWIYRRSEGGQWVAFETKRQAGYVEHKGTRITVRGRPDKWVEQVMITPRGLAKLAAIGAGR